MATIATVGDAVDALGVVLNDLQSTKNNVDAAANSSWWSMMIPGNGDLATQSYSLITQMTDYAGRILSEINGLDPSTPLTTQQIAQMKELQQEVIDGRKLIGQSISAVNWTFGGIFADATTIIENTASQAVAGVSSTLGINWTAVMLVLGGVVIFLIWYKVT